MPSFIQSKRSRLEAQAKRELKSAQRGTKGKSYQPFRAKKSGN